MPTSRLDFRAATLDVYANPGTDVTWRVQVTDEGITVGTIACTAGSQTPTVDTSLSIAGMLIADITLTDTQTTALATGSHAWTFSNTVGGVTTRYLVGNVTITPTGNTSNGMQALVTATSGTAVVQTLVSSSAATAIAAHLIDPTGAHAATAVAFTPTGTIAATDTQTAVAEVATDAAAALTAHTGNATDAHDASTVSVLDTAGLLTAVNVETALAELALKLPAGWVTPAQYGTVDLTGTNDSSTAVLAMLAAINTTGATVLWPMGTIRIDSQILFPNNGASPPKQGAQRWVGAGAWFSGKSVASDPYGGTILDLRYSSGPCIETLGEGTLEITGLTITQKGTAHTQPFIHTTNTTLLLHDMGFAGHTSKAAATANQDAIVLGGTGYVIGGGTNAPFQGYGTTIERCWFNKIKRGVWGRAYANGVKIVDNTWWAQCGGGAGSSAIEFDGGANSVDYNVGGAIRGNLIECIGYAAAMRFDYTLNFTIVGNDFYDNQDIATSYIAIGNNAYYNLITAGHYVATKPLVNQVNRNTIIDPNQNQVSEFTELVEMKDLTITGQSGALEVRPDAATIGDNHVMIRFFDGSSVERFRVQENGGIYAFGNQAGAIDADFPTAGTGWRINANTWQRKGVGGGMVIDSGTGGSNVDIKGFALRLYDQASALHTTIGASSQSTINSASGKTLSLQTNGTNRIVANSTGIGFFAATPVAKPTVTGSRTDGTALTSLLTALASLGLVTDSSTA